MLKIAAFFLFLLSPVLVLSQTEENAAIASKGDGIYSLLRKNGLDPGKFYQQFINLNKKNLNANNGLYLGQTYLLPQINAGIVDNLGKAEDKDQDHDNPDAYRDENDDIEDEEDSDPNHEDHFEEELEKIQDMVKDTIVEDKSTVNPSNLNSSNRPMEKDMLPYFGNNLSNLVLKNRELEGAIYYLISGHGGPDPGAIANYMGNQISEDEYAYDVTLRLARSLLSSGAKVYVIINDPNDGIRDKSILEIDYDEVNYPGKRIPRDQKLRLKQRTQTVNQLYGSHKNQAYQRLLVIHVDSRNKNQNIDVFFYHDKNSKSGKRLAENIQNSFRQKYAQHQPNRKYYGSLSTRNLYMIKNTTAPMVYIELGNIHNKKDQKRILNYNNREALAKWITRGLLMDFEMHNHKNITN